MPNVYTSVEQFEKDNKQYNTNLPLSEDVSPLSRECKIKNKTVKNSAPSFRTGRCF